MRWLDVVRELGTHPETLTIDDEGHALGGTEIDRVPRPLKTGRHDLCVVEEESAARMAMVTRWEVFGRGDDVGWYEAVGRREVLSECTLLVHELVAVELLDEECMSVQSASLVHLRRANHGQTYPVATAVVPPSS